MSRSVKALLLGLLLLLPRAAGADEIRHLHLLANDLVYDPFSRMIYASIAGQDPFIGNTLTALDPETGIIGRSVPVGSEPDRLTLSDDGRYLYVALDGRGAIRRVDLASMTPDLQIALGSDPLRGPISGADFKVLPGHSQSVAVSRQNSGSVPRNEGIAIYDDGVPRPVTTPPGQYSDRILFGATASRLYSYTRELNTAALRRIAVDAAGAHLVDTDGTWIEALGMFDRFIFASGLIYTDAGQVIDPEARRLIGRYPGVVGNAPFVVDAAVGRIYFLAGDYRSRRILAYDLRAFAPVGSLEIPGTIGWADTLIRWGANGLAFRTHAGDDLYLIRTSLILTDALSLSVTPASLTGGKPASATLTLRGGAPAGGAVIRLASSNRAAATVPASVTVPAGATVASFPVLTSVVTAPAAVTLTARYGALTRTAQLMVRPPDFGLQSNPPALIGGGTSTVTLTFAAAAPARGYPVTLRSDTPAVASVPARLTVPAGAASASFMVRTAPVAARTFVTISAQFGGQTRSARLAVLPKGPTPVPVQFVSLSPNRVVGGSPSTATLYLTEPALPGTIVPLTSSNPAAAIVPTQGVPGIPVPEGSGTATVRIDTHPVAAPTVVVISAGSGTPPATARLLVVPPSLTALSFEPASLTGVGAAVGTVTISAPAPPGGLAIAQTTDPPKTASLPPSIIVPAGATAAAFRLTVGAVPANVTLLVSASFGGTTLTTPLPVFSAAPVVAPDSVFQFHLPTNDIGYDPYSQRLYASIPSGSEDRANSITPVDPATGLLGVSISVGSGPGRLAISDDGQYLYVSVDKSLAVRRVVLSLLIAVEQFPVGGDPLSGPYGVADLQVLPGTPDSIAVARNYPGSGQTTSVAIFDHEMPRPSVTPLGEGSDLLQFSATASRLYGYDNSSTQNGFRRMAVSEHGISAFDLRTGLFGGRVDIQYDNGLIYTSSGLAIDPEAYRVVGQFPGIPPPGDSLNFPFVRALVRPDSAHGGVYFLTGEESTRHLLVFDSQSYVQLGTIDIPGVSGIATRLLRWGRDGLAFRTSAGQLFLIRTSLIPSQDLALRFAPAGVTGSLPAIRTVALPGPAPAGGTQVDPSSGSPAVTVPPTVIVPRV